MIGEVFVSNFASRRVLETYADYINNFNAAMEVAKAESKRKSAFADFLKVKQLQSSDRWAPYLLLKIMPCFNSMILIKYFWTARWAIIFSNQSSFIKLFITVNLFGCFCLDKFVIFYKLYLSVGCFQICLFLLRLNLFGLMVKPIQRFPQFIMLVQDLLKETPPGHQDR